VPESGKDEIKLVTTYPGLIMGTGYSHETGNDGEFKIGLHFDFSYGIPVLPGSSIKGILRSAFPQFKPDPKNNGKRNKAETDTEIKNEKARYIGQRLLGWKEEEENLFDRVHELEQHIFEGLDLIESSENNPVYHSTYKRDVFFDAFPIAVLSGEKQLFLGTDAITPHRDGPLKNPTPLPFLKILPGVLIRFGFNLAATEFHSVTADQRKKLYEKILMDFGTGAKTNVGYGQFETYPEFLRRNIKKGTDRTMNKPTRKFL